uniref:GAF domain-containing protein n=1 Tax=Candidatus Kentrum sp. FM TaxID=2126340 RepID=A0A450VMG6_9GAMM|nr:MAG: GAF domain-containing protein [Candidatus Kentron sp. FM]VFJ51509.1 MAG: GAF domain-containing protein [Candidatus Kentron sp. FM]VFK05890.1 MAG: GAF domain-containing protein [Candidatus Kentron sp. FM]
MDPEKQALQTLSTLLQLGREAAASPDLDTLSFLIVNDTHRLIRYDRALLWRIDARAKIHFQAASGISRIERNSPYIVWLKGIANFMAKGQRTAPQASEQPSEQPSKQSPKPQSVHEQQLPPSLKRDWQRWLQGSQPLYIPLIVRDNAPIAGCWLERKQQWTDAEKELLQHLMGQYALAFHSLQLETQGSPWAIDSLWRRVQARRVRYGLLFALCCLLFLPVRISVLAKAEITPIDPIIVTAPMDGVVHRFFVTPNQWAGQGDLLFMLDDTRIRNQVEITRKAVQVVEANLRRSHRAGFQKRKDLAETRVLEERLAEQQSELAYHQALLDRSRVHAQLDGLAIFNDANDWLGRPVQTGEKVLSLADPEKVEVRLLLSVQDAIHLPKDAEVLVFLDIDPLHPLDAILHRQSYEGRAQPDGSVVFPLYARLADTGALPRIGLQGTAKIYGQRVTLYYYLFRRPLVIVRQTLGL